jgi:hypothetical protein
MPQRKDQDTRPEPYPIRRCGRERQGGEGVKEEGRRVRGSDRHTDVIRHPNVGKAELFGLTGARSHAITCRGAELGEAHPEIHRNGSLRLVGAGSKPLRRVAACLAGAGVPLALSPLDERMSRDRHIDVISSVGT